MKKNNEDKKIKKIEKKIELCSSCQKNPAEKLHTCPFQEDVNNDFKSLCNCCEKCEQECCWDI